MQYIKRRDGVFQYVRRVPKTVVDRPAQWAAEFNAHPVFRRSLRTKDRLIALRHAQEAEIDFEQRVARALGTPPTRGVIEIASLPVRIPTVDELASISSDIRTARTRRWYQTSMRADVDPMYADELERMFERRREEAEARLAAIHDPHYVPSDIGHVSPKEWAQEINSKLGYNLPTMAMEFGAIVGAVREGMVQAERDIDALGEGAMVPPEATSPLVKRAERINEAIARVSPRISEAIDDYLKAGGRRGPFPYKTVQAVKRSLAKFIEAVGDKRLHAITTQDARGFAEYVANKRVGGKSEGSIERPTSRGTVQKELTFIRSSISLAIESGKFEGPNPIGTLNLDRIVKPADRATMPAKRPFEAGELIALLKHPWFAGCASPDEPYKSGETRIDDVRFWAPMVALYTGMRASELGGLRIAEVRFDDPYPHIVVMPNQYRDTKNGHARKVPILDALIDLGFRTYFKRIAATGSDRVFPDWEPPARYNGTIDGDDKRWAAAKWIRAFNRTVIPTALKGFLTEGARHPVTFHSLRGSFKRMLAVNRAPRHFIDEVIGHAKNDLDERYIGEIPIDETYPVMRGFGYRLAI